MSVECFKGEGAVAFQSMELAGREWSVETPNATWCLSVLLSTAVSVRIRLRSNIFLVVGVPSGCTAK